MLLKLAGIGKLFGARAVLRNISFEVHPGTVTLLVGANGAGKTTLLKIMAGLARPTVGTVERFCEDGGLGYLGHATFIYPGLTALENLAFWSGMHGNPTDKATLSEALARVELAPFAEERAGTFSRGMAQRLNLARHCSCSTNRAPGLMCVPSPSCTGRSPHPAIGAQGSSGSPMT